MLRNEEFLFYRVVRPVSSRCLNYIVPVLPERISLSIRVTEIVGGTVFKISKYF